MATSKRRSSRGTISRRETGNGFRPEYSYMKSRFKGPTFPTFAEADDWLLGEEKLIHFGQWSPPGERSAKTKAAEQQAELDHAAYTLESWSEPALERRTGKGGVPLSEKYLFEARGFLRRTVYGHPFAAKPLTEVTEQDIHDWFHTTLAPDTEGRGATQRAKAYGLLKTIFNQAIEEDRRESLATRRKPRWTGHTNPCTVKGGSNVERRREPVAATQTQLVALANAAPPAWRMFVLLSAFCALRFGEAAALQRGDVDLERGTVRIARAYIQVGGVDLIRAPKAGSKRVVTVPVSLVPALGRHLDDHVGGSAESPLFPSKPKGEQVTPHSTVGDWWREWRQTVPGCETMTGHDLRHSGATLAAQSGATLREVMQRLGHTTTNAAMKYQSATELRQRQIADALLGDFEGLGA